MWALLIDNALALTLLFVFLAAIITLVLQQRRRDKCLKLLGGYHASYITTAGKVMWGELRVHSKGLELIFDAPYRNRLGLIKTGVLIYEPELEGCLAVCRTANALTDAEQRARRRQVQRTFQPNIFRRAFRGVRNMLSTLKDAFSQTLVLLIGHLAKARPGSAVLTTQRGSVEQIGQTMLGAAANAYEPLLERHIGKPVLLELASPADPDKRKIELPGYLVDYTDRWIAVFNVEHRSREELVLDLSGPIELPGLKIEVSESEVTVICTGPDTLVVTQLWCGESRMPLDVVITNGTTLRLQRTGTAIPQIHITRTRRLDVVCPRAQAKVQFASAELEDVKIDTTRGSAPQLENSQAH